MDKLLTLSYVCTDWPGHLVGRAPGPPDSKGLVVGSPWQWKKQFFDCGHRRTCNVPLHMLVSSTRRDGWKCNYDDRSTAFVTLSSNITERIRTSVNTECTQWTKSCPSLLTNSIMRNSDILHWFQFLRLTDQEKIHSQVRKILSKMLFFATFTGFRCKGHSQKGYYECVTASILLCIRIRPVN